MVLYARTLLNRDIPRAFSFSFFLFLFLFSLSFFSYTLLFLIFHYTLLSPTHPFLPDVPTTLVSSFSNFPRWRYRPLCFFLDTLKRLNATTSPLRFLFHFLYLLRGLIYRNGAICCRDATKEKRNQFSAFSFIESLVMCEPYKNEDIRGQWNVNDRLIQKTLIVLYSWCTLYQSQQQHTQQIVL